MPRHAETLDMQDYPKLNYQFEDDTIYDPPLIRDIDQIVERILFAQKKLQENQINSFLGTPRQLIPISIHDLIPRKWLINDE